MIFKSKIIPNISGKILATQSPNTLYIGQKHRIYRSVDFGKNWQLVGILPVSLKRRCGGWNRLLRRLLRYELRSLAVSENGAMLPSSREGVYWSQGNQLNFQPTELPNPGWPIYSPMTITADSQNRFLWGEYWMNPDRKPIGIYASYDGGKTHQMVHEFAAGEVRHIHQVIEDPSIDGYWVLTGDEDRESGIGRLSRDFKEFNWLIHGSQQYRAVVLFPLADHLIYATDTEKDYNHIYVCDKASGKVEKI